MPEFFKIVVLSVVQGLTEFLPVSSSGHLVLAKHLVDLGAPGVTLELFLHAGTLAAVVIFYRRKLVALLLGVFKLEKAPLLYAAWILLSMLPVGVSYALGRSGVEAKYEDPRFVARALCITGFFLSATALVRKWEGGRTRESRFKWFHALAMGAAQAVAMLPGVSRSGSTIATARFLGVKPNEAAEFSFIMSVPVIAGAVLLDLLKNAGDLSSTHILQYAVGAVIAGAIGIVAIKSLVAVLGKGKLWIFGVYCIVVGLTALVLL